MDSSLALWRRAVAEALAAFALVFAGCGAIVANAQHDGALGAVGAGRRWRSANGRTSGSTCSGP